MEERIVGAIVAGKYRIRRVVGAGSMGVVCEAEHIEIGKRLAIKIIDASLLGMTDITLRFRQEARAASLVESHHIVQVFDVGQDDALGLYLVMEYLTGEDLSAMLAREKRIAPEKAVRIAVQVARGLAKAHDAGVIHRDLKPANIFLTEREDDEPLVKILDFGISKVIDASRAESKLKLTRAGTVVGTPQYMSPEQAQGFTVDERTDVWALGLVLYEMLAGRPAYPELPTYEAFIIHLVSHPPDRLSDVAPWVPAPLAQVVHAALEHDMGKRIPACLDLARRLLEAHPVVGLRAMAASTADMSDTWADPSSRSPFFVEEHGSGERATTSESVPASRTVIANESPPEDSLTIDVDVPIEAPAVRTAAAAPRAATSPVTRSGVRGPGHGEDFEEDAPQFFDRKSLERVGGAPSSGSPQRVATGAAAMDVPVSSGPVPISVTAADRRIPLGWMALAFIALGLVVVAALALR